MGWSARGALMLSLLVTTGTLRAEAPSESAAVARQLFDQGRTLMANEDYERACPKFEEAMRLDPGGGTILNLALCNELRGKTATAWAQYDEALRWARRDGRADREELAAKHRAELEPRLAKLVVVLASGAKVAGMSVRRDGVPMGEGSLGEALPLDPGEHVLEASAPGKKPFRGSVRLREGETSTFSIPPLVTLPRRAPTPRAEPARANETLQTWGTLLVGAGAAATLIGARFGYQAIEQRADAEERCPKRQCEHLDAVKLNDAARKNALASTLLVAGGFALIGGGTWLLVSAEPKQEAASLAVRGRF